MAPTLTDQEMGIMEEKTNFRSTAFDGACRTILTTYPQAIGVAFKFLDCGCSLLCGVSAQGNPIGEMIHVSGQPAKKTTVWSGLFGRGFTGPEMKMNCRTKNCGFPSEEMYSARGTSNLTLRNGVNRFPPSRWHRRPGCPDPSGFSQSVNFRKD
jgi:hypothetical protein